MNGPRTQFLILHVAFIQWLAFAAATDRIWIRIRHRKASQKYCVTNGGRIDGAPDNASAEDEARAKAEARRQRILEKSRERLGVVAGELPATEEEEDSTRSRRGGGGAHHPVPVVCKQ